MQRARPLLIGFVVLVPLLSAIGFMEMSRSLSDATGVARHQAISQSATLEPWRQIILASYITLIVGAILAGRARNAVTEDT